MTEFQGEDADYFSVDLPGLSKTDAAMIVSDANRRQQCVGGYVVDPAEFLTMHLDAPTTKSLAAAVQFFLNQHPLGISENDGLDQLLEQLRDWLG